MNDSDAVWCRQHFSLMADGGIWGVPRSGLIFTRRGDKLVLIDAMPYLEEMAEAFAAGDDVPANAEALREYQDEDFELIRAKFELAGITVDRQT